MTTPLPQPRRASAVDGITGLRLLPPGAAAQLLNMSPTGLLAESTARLHVGAAVTVSFEGGFHPPTASGRVVRCEVAVMARDGVLHYHLGIEFDQPLQWDDGAQAAPAPASPRARNRW